MKLTTLLTTLLLAVFVFAQSPSGNYAPGNVKCPAVKSFIREGDSISPKEQEWISKRSEKTQQALKAYLDYVDLEDFDSEEFFTNSSVNLAITVSGGGYRSMLTGAGQLAALDNRTTNGSELGLGGVLQSANYISALSGGSWLLGSLSLQDWPSVESVVLEDAYDVWNFTDTRVLLNTKGLWTIAFSVLFDSYNGFIKHLNNWVVNASKKMGIKYDIQSKEDAGYHTSVTDPWGRGLGYQLFPEGKDEHGQSLAFSDIRDTKAFQNQEMPFPLITAIGRRPETTVYHLNSTVVEFNPFEMGSFDPSLNTFTDLKYVGSNVRNGVPQNQTCVQGFDNAAFVIGTSSSLFNSFLNSLVCDGCTTLKWPIKGLVKKFLTKLSTDYLDIAWYKPNPFRDSKYANSELITKNETLFLMDGGLANETLALSSLLVKQRNLDAVIALDSGENWPKGKPLIAAYERQFSNQGKHMVVPHVPDYDTFLHNNLTAKPTFFGCNANNLTDLTKDGVVPPLVIYIANRPFSFYSNTSLYKMKYTDEEKKGMIRNGFETVSRLNGTIDEKWPKCVGCALIRREQERQGIEATDECQECFDDYCWDGSVYEHDGPYYPPVNFTLTGLTNDSFGLVGDGNGAAYDSTSGSLSNLIKRD